MICTLFLLDYWQTKTIANILFCNYDEFLVEFSIHMFSINMSYSPALYFLMVP